MSPSEECVSSRSNAIVQEQLHFFLFANALPKTSANAKLITRTPTKASGVVRVSAEEMACRCLLKGQLQSTQCVCVCVHDVRAFQGQPCSLRLMPWRAGALPLLLRHCVGSQWGDGQHLSSKRPFVYHCEARAGQCQWMNPLSPGAPLRLPRQVLLFNLEIRVELSIAL